MAYNKTNQPMGTCHDTLNSNRNEKHKNYTTNHVDKAPKKQIEKSWK